MAITINGTNGLTSDNAALKLDGTTLVVDETNNRVGVGTASPTNTLHVYGGSNTQFKVESSGAEANMTLAGTSYAQINNSVGDLYVTTDASATNIILRIASTEKVRINQYGLTFNGDTAAANALDDYEEGTWTPTLLRSGSSYTFGDNSSGYRTGKYVKIGNLVCLWFSISINSIATQGSSYNQISGFPFTTGGDNFTRWGGSVTVSECLTSATSMYMGGGATQAYFSNSSGPLQNNFVTGAIFGFLSYQV